MDFFGTISDDILQGQEGNDFLVGDAGNDSLIGGAGDDQLVGGDGSNNIGGKDTLEGGVGNDGYLIALGGGGGSQVNDTEGTDAVLVVANNTNLEALTTPESYANASLYEDSAIALSLPQAGIIGLSKSGNNLIIDLDRNGVAQAENDLTIIGFFNQQGQLGINAVESINNITNTQDIVNFFNNSAQDSNDPSVNSNLTSLTETSGNDLLNGTAENDVINGGTGDDTIIGFEGDDLLSGGAGNDFLAENILTANSTSNGRDTLQGGDDNDSYIVSLDGGGTIVEDTSGSDRLGIVAQNSDINALAGGSVDYADSSLYGDAAVSLSLPQAGIIGLSKSENDLIIDRNRDGIAETENDLTIVNFFIEDGTTSSIEAINNIADSQEIVSFFTANSQETLSSQKTTVYRFLNNDTGVHLYTADAGERDTVEQSGNFSFEGASYNAVDPVTGGVPVYRFLNQDTGVYLYTISQTERDATENLNNFSFEGEAFFAYGIQVDGSIPIYRFFNSTTGAHFYTPSVTERDNVDNNLPDFQSEGIAYYALPNDDI